MNGIRGCQAHRQLRRVHIEILVMQKQIKKFRHDSSHHFTALKGYFINNQNQEGLTYIEKLNNDFEQGKIVDTGNTAFDAIISSKKALAESKNIKFVTRIQIPEMLELDAVDLCVIFGNALDNAIEACEKLETHREPRPRGCSGLGEPRPALPSF